MATKGAHKRLLKEYAAIQQSPPPFIIAKPNEKNILEWHYVISGPPDSPYHNGEYHGKLVFPSQYPFAPPSIYMITPNGRFKPSTKLCLSMSDFHPENWNPAWSVASILTGLLSFMLENTETTGSITTTESERKTLAKKSRRYNREQNPKFVEMFPDLARESKELPDDIGKPKAKEESRKSSQPKDALDGDIIINEIMRYFLVTGANSGVGFGLLESIMGVCNEDSSKDNDPLTLILACRNQQKAELAMNNLRQRYPNALMKVKLEFLKVDLTNKHSICDAMQMYRDRYPKIDVFYANAGILLASGVDYLKGTIQMFTNTEAFFKTSGDILVQKVECVNNDGVGTVFMANVFGHYAMIKGLQDLFNEGSRIVWTGSATATSKYFSWKDMDGSRSNFPYESSKYATQLLSCALNSALKEQGVSSYYCEPGSVCTSIMDDQMSWFIQTFLMIPVMFIGSMFLDYVTFNSLNGALALFFLSGLKSAESIKCDGETTLDENQKVPDPKFMYGSRCKYFSGDGRYVAKEPLEETLTSSECSRFLSEIELLRQKLLFSEQ